MKLSEVVKCRISLTTKRALDASASKCGATASDVMRVIITSIIGDLSGSRLALATRPYPATTNDHPTSEPVRYSTVEGARTGFLATGKLHHHWGHDPKSKAHLLAVTAKKRDWPLLYRNFLR